MTRIRPSLRVVGAAALLASPFAASLAQARPAPAARASQASQSTLRIPFERYTMPNGMTVVLAQDRTTPTVAVVVMYHVGSKNEQVGRTGFAHLFEHVMFTGSGHVPYGTHDRMTEGVGGMNNGGTNNDMTVYYETVPSNYLETALWLESDRMGWLLDALDTAKYNAQREIVKNERRQRVDNQPYGRVGEILSAAIYPASHPYSWPVIGSMADLSAATIEDVKDFFRLYYAPNNATLVITGDFDMAQANRLVMRYFGEIPRGRPIRRPVVRPVTLTAEKRLVYEDRVQVPRLYIQWPTVGQNHADQYALDVLAAILSGPRTARLTKALVYDRQVAASVSAFQSTDEDVGEFQVSVTPRPGNSLTAIELAVDSIIDRMRREGPTAEELQRAKAGLELAFVRNLESVIGKAFTLAQGQVFDRDPAAFQRDFRMAQAVTAADVRRVANRYLTNGRVVLSVVPNGRRQDASKPEASTPVTSSTTSTNTSAPVEGSR